MFMLENLLVILLFYSIQVVSDMEAKHSEIISSLKSDYEQKLIELEGEQLRQQEELEKRHQIELDDCVTGSKEEIALARNEQREEMKQLQVRNIFLKKKMIVYR